MSSVPSSNENTHDETNIHESDEDKEIDDIPDFLKTAMNKANSDDIFKIKAVYRIISKYDEPPKSYEEFKCKAKEYQSKAKEYQKKIKELQNMTESESEGE